MSPPPPSSLELLLLERAKALQQHHHHQQQQQQHHSSNNITSPSLKPFPHFPSQGFGSLRPGLFPPANSNSSGLGGGFHSGPEELLQRWRQQLPHNMPANIQEDSRMDITAAPPPAPVTPTQSSPREKTAPTAAADSLAGGAFSRPDPSPSPTGSITHHREQAVSPPTSSLVEDLPPAVAVLNGGNIGDRQLQAEGENEEENLAAVEDDTKEKETTVLTDIDRESPGRCQENSSPVKSEDSNLGELMTPQLPALSPLSPYSSALGLGLPSLLSSASR
jgi:hypothetical protein